MFPHRAKNRRPNVSFLKRRSKNLDNKNSSSKIEQFLKVEKGTFGFIKSIGLLLFTVNIGVMITIFNIPKYSFISVTIGTSLFISIFLLFLALKNFRNSIISYEKYDLFISYRKKSYSMVLGAFYISLLAYEISLIIYIGLVIHDNFQINLFNYDWIIKLLF